MIFALHLCRLSRYPANRNIRKAWNCRPIGIRSTTALRMKEKRMSGYPTASLPPRQSTRRSRLLSTTAVAVLALGSAGAAHAAACSSPYVTGDVFASVGSSTVDVFTPTGTLVCSMNDASGTTFTTGSGFDGAGNFYVTNFGAQTVSKFNNSGGLVNSSFMSPPTLSNNSAESIDNQTTGFYAGLSNVGGPGAALINQFNTSTGALVHSYSVTGGNFTGGTDWVDTYNKTTGQVIYDGAPIERLATRAQSRQR